MNKYYKYTGHTINTIFISFNILGSYIQEGKVVKAILLLDRIKEILNNPLSNVKQ